jgi:hypothetical protein
MQIKVKVITGEGMNKAYEFANFEELHDWSANQFLVDVEFPNERKLLEERDLPIKYMENEEAWEDVEFEQEPKPHNWFQRKVFKWAFGLDLY